MRGLFLVQMKRAEFFRSLHLLLSLGTDKIYRFRAVFLSAFSSWLHISLQLHKRAVFSVDSVFLTELRARALNIRRDVVRMMGVAKTGHMASSLSVVDILVWLYGVVLSVRPAEPLWAARDRFVLSKAPASPALYAVLAERGFFKRDELWGYRRLGSNMQAFADAKRTPGVDVSCGSLGMGAGISLGLALTLRNCVPASRVFCLMGDGELQEGAVWEALMASAHHRLGNLTLIVDRNSFQSEGETEKILALEPLTDKFKAFGWSVACANGHDFEEMTSALASLPVNEARVLIARTTRGKGIPSLERGLLNGKVVLDRQTTEALLKELDLESEGERDGGDKKPARRL